MSNTSASSIDFFRSIDTSAALHTLGNNQSSMYMIMDREHRFQHVNSRFAEMLGYDPVHILGKSDLDLGLPDELLFGNAEAELPGVHLLDEYAMKSGESTCTMDGTVDLGSGSYDSTVTIRTPLKNNAGDVIGLLIQCIDESDVHRLEQQVQSTHQSLTSLDKDLVALDSILADMISCTDVQSLLDKIAENVVARTAADGVYIAAISDSQEHLVGMAAQGNFTEAFTGKSWRKGEDLIGKAWDSNESIFIEDASKNAPIFPFTEKTQLLTLPISSQGEVVATLTVTSQSEDNNLARELPGLTRIAGMAGIAIANAKLLAATDVTLQQTYALSEMSQELTQVSSIDDACNAVCRMLLSRNDVVEVSSIVKNDEGLLKQIATWRSIEGHSRCIETADTEILQESFAKWCIATGEYAVVRHGEHDTRETAHVSQALLALDIGSTYCAPLLKDDGAMGALLISRSRDGANFDESALGVFRTAANQLTAAFERQALSSALHHQAFHDRLTGLPNRHHFESTLETEFPPSATTAPVGAVLFIDLDGFKEVNDTMGHAIGDKLLQAVANTFSAQLNAKQILARMGGDEFSILLPNAETTEAPVLVAEKLLKSLANSFLIQGAKINIGCSIGVSQYPQDGNTVDDILRSADIAMYQAKQDGKGKIICFDEKLASVMLRRSQLLSDLRLALTKEQFELHYQPQVCCQTENIRGLEALIRWKHPVLGYISPVEFIPIAEDSGLINSIGAWVVNQAIYQLAAWQNTKFDGVRVSINIAASQFQSETFIELVMGAILAHKADARLLELEVTEGVLMENLPLVAKRLEILRRAGIRIAIDDFGTGYSSLSYLQDLPLDVLKIDRSFVTRLQDEPAEQSLANTITLLATGLGLETIAEGVETIEQRDAVISLGCSLIQGFFYSKPLSPADLCGITDRISGEAFNLSDRAA